MSGVRGSLPSFIPLYDEDEHLRRKAARASPRIEKVSEPIDEELAAAEADLQAARQRTADAYANVTRLQRRRHLCGPRPVMDPAIAGDQD